MLCHCVYCESVQSEEGGGYDENGGFICADCIEDGKVLVCADCADCFDELDENGLCADCANND